MPATIHLQVNSSDGTSRAFALAENDTFLLGRMEDCHLCMPGDPQVSRIISCSKPARPRCPCAILAASTALM